MVAKASHQTKKFKHTGPKLREHGVGKMRQNHKKSERAVPHPGLSLFSLLNFGPNLDQSWFKVSPKQVHIWSKVS